MKTLVAFLLIGSSAWASLGAAKAWIAIADRDIEMERPVLPDDLKDRGAAPAARPAAPQAPVRRGYPIRAQSTWWTHPGPSTQANMIRHMQEGEHAGKFPRAWLETLSREQLESLHSDHHEGRTKWEYVGNPKPAKVADPVDVGYRPQRIVNVFAPCPNGNCPNVRRKRDD